MITDYGLSDVFRLLRGNDRFYTHFNRTSKTYSRLDFFLIDDALVNFPVCHPDISHGLMSDHSYISLHLRGTPIERGRGYWKLNNSHLEDEKFVENIHEIIHETSSESFDTYQGLWDVIKFKVKLYAIQYGKSIKRNISKEKESLRNEISRIQAIPNCMDSENLRNTIIECESKLNTIINREVKGVITRSRADWVEKGERSTRYFFGLEKSRGKKRELNKLVSGEETLYEQEKISKHVVEYFQNVYSSSKPCKNNISNYLNGLGDSLPKLNCDSLEFLESEISEEEIDVVVGKLKNNKSPGWDGLTAEFYVKFWEVIRPILFKSFLESIGYQFLSQSQRLGILTLIPKPKPPTELVHLKNWRPITLLNVDYKIFAHVIKNRVMKAIPKLINNVQTGFQPGKSTADNILLMCSVLEDYFENPQQEGLILQVDFEKAFDSVEHEFLFATLEKMGFGNYMLRLIKTAFGNCSSYANVNGHLSAPIHLLRGLHQGSPLSPVLFLLVAQVFSSKIISNKNISGLNIHGVDILMSLFADDTDMFLQAECSNVKEVMAELTSFGMLAGCKANIDKTKCILLGKSRDNDALKYILKCIYGKDFLQDKFTALGVDFDNHNSLQHITTQNYNNKLAKAQNSTIIWGKRDLTIMGKATIIKSLVYSQFSYISAPLLFPNEKILKNIEKLVFSFLWSNKPDKIKREIIMRPKDEGGLDLFHPKDFIRSLKLSIISRFINPNFKHPWKDMFINQLKFPSFPILSFENKLLVKEGGLVHDIVCQYAAWKLEASERNKYCQNHCVWSNKLLPPIGIKLWNSYLIDKDILFLSDFISPCGTKLFKYDEFIDHWNLDTFYLSRNEFHKVTSALKQFNRKKATRNIFNLRDDITLKFFDPFKSGSFAKVQGSKIRKVTTAYHSPIELSPMQSWCSDLGTSINTWNIIFTKIFSLCNNLKLIQFQYKLLMRISTCKALRCKMKISQDEKCTMCGDTSETLKHIFLECPVSSSFIESLNKFISEKVEPGYSDTDRVLFITCDHTNIIVNYLNMVSKWYLSRCFQNETPVSWHGLTRLIKKVLCGEKKNIKNKLFEILS